MKRMGKQKVMDLQRAEESHDLGAIHRILRETGLSVGKTFRQRSGILPDQKRQPHTWNFADRVLEIPTKYRLDCLLDGQEIRSTILSLIQIRWESEYKKLGEEYCRY